MQVSRTWRDVSVVNLNSSWQLPYWDGGKRTHLFAQNQALTRGEIQPFSFIPSESGSIQKKNCGNMTYKLQNHAEKNNKNTTV